MTDFTTPPAGMLSHQADLPDHHMSVGLMHIEGAGVRVCTWDGERLRHMSLAAARRFASDIEAGPHAAELGPVIQAVRDAADKGDEAMAAATASRAERFADMPVEGHA